MTSNQIETNTASSNQNKEVVQQSQQNETKKNKKRFVYTPESSKDPKSNQPISKKEEPQPIKPNQSTEKNNNKKQKKQNNLKKNKKQFVYVPNKEEKKSENEENQKENSQLSIIVSPTLNQQEQIRVSKNENKLQEETKTNKSKKNKKQFVYNPEKETKKSENEKVKQIENQSLQKDTETTPELVTSAQSATEIKESEKPKANEPTESKSKKNKMQFIYNPNEQETKSNTSNERIENQNNSSNQNNKNSNKNNHNNNYKKNHKNNNVINMKIVNNKAHQNQKSANFNRRTEKDSINYTTYIELDMHGSDPNAKRPFEWIPVIRDALFSALEKNVDVVRFIPGKGLHSNPENGPILRILVLLTSKRLGFDSIINPDNEGVIICKISNRVKNSAFVLHMPNKDEQEDLIRNDTLLKAFGMKSGDHINIDNLSFRAVKSRFPHMPTICIGIICAKRTPKEAVEFAQLFEDSLSFESNVDNSKENEKSELLAEMKMIESLEEKYGFDLEIIERVVREKRKQNKSQSILDRISSEIPNNFFCYLTEFLLNFSHVPIETLLDSMKEGLYNPNEITKILNSKSWRGMQNALSVMKVENKITTERTDGRPKFIPTIEIDLSKASSEKAQMTIDKIMNGLGNENFSEMVLLLPPKNKKSNKCTLDDINCLLYKKACQEGFHIIRSRRADEKNNRYHFTIFNHKDEI